MAQTSPPYASQKDIRTFFDKMEGVGPPNEITTDWVDKYGLAASQSSAIVNLLEWLGVVDEDGSVDADLWNSLRVPQKKQDVLRGLVEGAYEDVFNAVDVSSVDKSLIRGAFIESYGSGSADRYVRAFLTMCQLAGIETGAQGSRGSPGRKTDGAVTKKDATPTKTPKSPTEAKPSPKRERARTQGPANGSHYEVSLNVEIPAEWDAEQVRERIRIIRESLGED